MSVIVDLALATICFLGQCHNALVGPDTPVGDFPLEVVTTQAPGYGGNVIVFKETAKYAWAIHRVYLLNPKQRRAQRLASPNPQDRITITLGCINVDPAVFDQLAACVDSGQCSDLSIHKGVNTQYEQATNL